MSTIQVSKQHIKQLEDYINRISEKYHKKVTKKSVIDRVINNYHYIIEENMIENRVDETSLVAIDEIMASMLKEEKNRLKKPMYLILDACLNQFFSHGKDVKKNIALCQFKHTNKTYAFYFDQEKISLKKGDLIQVKSANPFNPNKETIKAIKVKDLAYSDNAKEKYKPVIKIIK